MTRKFVWAATVAVAAVAAACNGAPGSAGVSPTTPSGNSGPAAVSSVQTAASSVQGLTAAESAGLTAACGPIGSGPVTTPGAPPPGTPPAGGTTGTGPGGLGTPGADGTVTTPGGAPGSPAPGAKLALGGAVERLSGSCPAVSFVIHGKTVRTSAATSFGSSCSLLKNNARVGATGTTQADGSIIASCAAGV